MNPDVQKFLLQRLHQTKALQNSDVWIKTLRNVILSLENTPLLCELQIKDVKILEILGSGAFGTVYKAVIRGREVALKQVNLDFGHPQLVINEKSFLQKLNHRAVIKLLHAWYETDVFMSTELCVGDLHHYMKFIDGRNAFRFIVQVLKAVQYIHSKDILHRDIKPPNILITDSNNVKLADFGLAIQLKEGEVSKVTGLCGTLPYLPIESLENGIYSKSSDMHMLGCTVFEIDTHSFLVNVNGLETCGPKDIIDILNFGRFEEKFVRNEREFQLDKEQELVREKITDRIKNSAYADLILQMVIKDPVKRISSASALSHPIIKSLKENHKCQIYDDLTEKVVKDNGGLQRQPIDGSIQFVTKETSVFQDILLLDFRYDSDKKNEKSTITERIITKDAAVAISQNLVSSDPKTPKVVKNCLEKPTISLFGSTHADQNKKITSDSETQNWKRPRVQYSSESSTSSPTLHTVKKRNKTKPLNIPEMPFLCCHCDKEFSTKGNLKRHVQRHEEVEIFSCPQCAKVFKRQDYLDSHVNNVHLKKVLQYCGKCGKALMDRAQVFYHQKVCSKKLQIKKKRKH